MKLIGDQLLVTTSRLQNYINGINVNSNDIKYRIMLINVDQLLNGTLCRQSSTPVRFSSAQINNARS